MALYEYPAVNRLSDTGMSVLKALSQLVNTSEAYSSLEDISRLSGIPVDPLRYSLLQLWGLGLTNKNKTHPDHWFITGQGTAFLRDCWNETVPVDREGQERDPVHAAQIEYARTSMQVCVHQASGGWLDDDDGVMLQLGDEGVGPYVAVTATMGGDVVIQSIEQLEAITTVVRDMLVHQVDQEDSR